MAGKRYSRQRELIYQCLMDSPEHPTAEMIYQQLKPDNPGLSLGTVYRNLNLLAREGVIVRMPFSVERYDGHTEPHSHFRCRLCGGVWDLTEVAYDPALDLRASGGGVQVERHDTVFTGLCRDCKA